MAEMKKLIILIPVFMLALTLAACGSKSEEESKTGSGDTQSDVTAAAATDITELIADASIAESIDMGNIKHVSAATVKENTIYFSGTENPSDTNNIESLASGNVYQLYYIDFDDLEPKPIQIPVEKELLTGSVTSMAVGDDGSIAFVLCDYSGVTDEEEINPDFVFKRLSRDGTLISKIKLTADAFRDDEWVYLWRLVTDASGRIYLVNTVNIYVWDGNALNDLIGSHADKNWQGSLLCKIPLNSFNIKLSLDRTGEKVYAAWSDNNTNIKRMAVVDPDLGMVGQSHDLNEFVVHYGMAPGLGADLLLASEKGIFDYDVQNESLHAVYSWEDGGAMAIAGTFSELLPLRDGRIGVLEVFYPDVLDLRLIRPRREGEERPDFGNREILTLGGLSTSFDSSILTDHNIRRAVSAFNAKSPRYYIEIIEYEDDYSAESAARFNMDIVSGKGPDIILLPPGAPLGLYARKGVLLDLYPLIDQNTGLNREDLQENIIKAYETEGQLFGIPTHYFISTFVAPKSAVGDISGWNLDEMIGFVNAELSVQLPNPKIFDDYSKSHVLGYCLAANGDALVDWNSDGSGFKRDIVIKMLEFANQFAPDDLYSWEEAWNNRIPWIQDEGLIKLLGGSFMNYDLGNPYYQAIFNEPVAYPGYPSENGNGNLISSRSVLGINSKLKDKDGAWEFLSFILSEEFQSDQTVSRAFPIRKSAHENMASRAMQGIYIEKDGIQVERPKGSHSYGDGFIIDWYAATESDIKAVSDVINSAEKIRIYDYQIMNIIREEAGIYFSGGKSAAEVVDIMENRIGLYVKEMK